MIRAREEDESALQGGAAGFNTGNREKLSSTQGGVAWVLAWMLLSFSLFLVSNPAAPLCSKKGIDCAAVVGAHLLQRL